MPTVAFAILGMIVQGVIFVGAYLLASPSAGRARALLYAGVIATFGYALVLLGLATVGVPWQVSNVLLAVAILTLGSTPGARRRLLRSRIGLTGWVRAGLPSILIVALLVAVQVIAVVLMPELSIDGQLYHGPVLAQLVSHGTVWGWDVPNQYMYYTDLAMLGGVNLATFTGRAVFDNGIQIPYLVVMILAVNVLLARRFQASWIRVSFAALLVASPVVWLQPRILYVDLAYGAAVATLMILILTTKRVGALEMATAAIAASAIFATKPAGILTGALLVLVWVVVAIKRRRAYGSRLAESFRLLALTGAPALGAAAGFYVRNLISFGNPAYPVQASLGPLRFRGLIDLGVFASGDRGSGLVDPGRIGSFIGSIQSGILHGVTKLDYDPRAGGFGYVPLVVVVLVAAVLVAQLTLAVVSRSARRLSIMPMWKVQVGAATLLAMILLIQPATFDTRYVIGPTVVALGALLLTTLESRNWIDIVAAAFALVFAFGQIVWTETNTYPGLMVAKWLRAAPEQVQPSTPGNPWGRGGDVSWLPKERCVTIVVQSNGGVGPGGMLETARLSTLPYALYGEQLCNTVEPVELTRLTDGVATEDPVPTADFLLLYEDDVNAWRTRYPDLQACWRVAASLPGTAEYPQAVTVIASRCA